jgi:hypothetical protein
MTPGGVCSAVMLPGIPAVLFMAVTQTLFKAISSSDRPLERMMAGVNHPPRIQSSIAKMPMVAIRRLGLKELTS